MLALALMLGTIDLNKGPGVICTVSEDNIVVRFGTKADDEFVLDKFAIVPSGSIKGAEWLYVVDPTFDVPLRLSPYRPKMKRLVIDTRRQLAVDYSGRTGKARIVPAFPKPGRYTLAFSDNLGTELENMVYWSCSVRVRHAAGPRAAPAKVDAPAQRR